MMAIINLCQGQFLIPRISVRGLRGAPRGHWKPAEPLQLDQNPIEASELDQPIAKDILNHPVENKVKSYRTYRQKIKQLKNNCSSKLVNEENQFELVKNAVTMLHDIPYSEQLIMKQNKHNEFIERLRQFKTVRNQISPDCISDIVASPIQESYRNKDLMSTGLDINGNLTVGFHVGGRKHGVVTVNPEPIKIIRDSHKLVAALYAQFLKSLPREHVSMYLGPREGWAKGNWSEIMIRSNYLEEMMINIEYYRNSQSNDFYEDEKARLIEKLLSCNLPISSIYITEVSVDKNDDDGIPLREKRKIRIRQLIYGEEKLIDQIGDLKMSLGPGTFCQGNTTVAEIMLREVKQRIKFGRHKTLLDLGCGSGMFSLFFAPYYRGVIGVDVEDTTFAETNAKLNSIGNCKFVTAGVQVLLPRMLKEFRNQGAGVSGILNPGRSGVPHNVINAIRGFPLINSLVYVSCKPEDERVMKNLVILMNQDHKSSSAPFTLSDSLPLDMFPHTHHCEHVFVFTRKLKLT